MTFQICQLTWYDITNDTPNLSNLRTICSCKNIQVFALQNQQRKIFSKFRVYHFNDSFYCFQERVEGQGAHLLVMGMTKICTERM